MVGLALALTECFCGFSYLNEGNDFMKDIEVPKPKMEEGMDIL